ncbi:MAG: hypothetical protein AB7K24_05935, partial [Gemmataceae bacterium]
LPEYLEHSGGKIYFVTRELGSLQEQLLAEGRDVPAIDASWFSVERFLERYAAESVNVKLVRLDEDVETLLRPASNKKLSQLLQYYAEQGIEAKLASFHPREVPALMVYPPRAELLRDSQTALETHDLPDSMAPLVQAFVSDQLASGADWQGTLYLNADCPFIKQLEKLEPGRLPPLLRMLYEMARLFCGRLLRPAEAAASFQEFTRALEEIAR